MKWTFSDTGYWWALLRPNDPLHEIAKRVGVEILLTNGIVTTDAVLFEVLNGLGRFGSHTRKQASAFIRRVLRDAGVEVVHITPEIMLAAVDMYERADDKYWSLTDCSSFVIMKERKIHSALTHDHHFEQAGFQALLR